MKRFLIITITAIALLSFWGCKNDSGSSDTSTQSTNQATASELTNPDDSYITNNPVTEAIDHMPSIEAATVDANTITQSPTQAENSESSAINSPTEATDNTPVFQPATFDENGRALVPDYDPFDDTNK